MPLLVSEPSSSGSPSFAAPGESNVTDGFLLTAAQWEAATSSCPPLDRRPILSTQSQIVPESARLTNLACAKCGSAEVRRLSLIYQEGLAIINTSSQTSGAAF